MKKILSILSTIPLIGTSTTSLVACDPPQKYTPEELKELKEKNKINTTNQEIKNNLEWISPQEKPFNEVDDKYYYVVWHSNSSENWRITKFKNDTKTSKENGKRTIVNEHGVEKLFIFMETKGFIKNKEIKFPKDITVQWNSSFHWKFSQPNSETVFKSVYRWNCSDQNLPALIVDNNGNVKVNGE
ncbi:lipoprotein [Spiroplasma endosymbiont of Polydrusus formosus]|uniref:lipoprotein n=1 Tax=Spiroplasma endosymbiont of Polydrusus formosus TaxID=3139326 RepID=UPI0035B556DF